MTRDFDTWLAQMRPSIATFDYYINFDKVIENAKSLKPELHLMNTLIGSADVESEFRNIVRRYPAILQCVPSLLAVREHEIFARERNSTSGVWFDFANGNNSIDEYCLFMRHTGLFDIIAKHLVNNLYDYVVGVETGLDSNGRKNRGGDLMEDLVELFLQKAGVEYYKEMKSGAIQRRWGVDLSALTNNDKTVKKFDFVVHSPTCVYGVEANFYKSNINGKGSGSKLSETARSYKMLALEAQGIQGFKFVWLTDGKAWNSAKDNLRETFEILPTVYNIAELEAGIASKIFV